MSTIVCRVFLAGDELFGVEKLSVGTSPDFIENRRLKIHIHGSRNVLAVSYTLTAVRQPEGGPVSEKKVLMLPFSVWSGFKRPSGYDTSNHPHRQKRGGGKEYVDSVLETVELYKTH